MLWINIECRHFDGAAAAYDNSRIFIRGVYRIVTHSVVCLCRFLSISLTRSRSFAFASLKKFHLHSFEIRQRRTKEYASNNFSSRSSNQQIQIQRQRLNGIVGHLNVFFLLFWLNQFCCFFVSCFSHHRSSFDCSFWMHMHFLMHNKPEKELRLMRVSEWACARECVWSSMCMLIFTRSEGNNMPRCRTTIII